MLEYTCLIVYLIASTLLNMGNKFDSLPWDISNIPSIKEMFNHGLIKSYQETMRKTVGTHHLRLE